MPKSSEITLSRLYDQDFALWLTQTIDQLENQQFETLDVKHVIEELKELGKELNLE